MSTMLALQKHFKTANAEVGSCFNSLVIPFIPKPSTLKTENSQEFNICITVTQKNSTYKFKAYTFANGSPKNVLEWEKKMQKIIKCKLVDTKEGKFDLVEAILKGDALTHWLELKQVEIVWTSKNPNGMDNPMFTVCLQEFKKQYFPKNLARL
eukprot:2589187-Ditylum_brightwellii.AAC.1